MLNDPIQMPSAPVTNVVPAATPPVAPATNGEAPADQVETAGRTVQEVEDEYKRRLGGKDRAHNAAEQTLRAENEALQKRLDALTNGPRAGAGQAGSEGQASGPDPVVAEQLRVANERTQQAEQQALIATRRSKYPALAAQVHDSILLANDEASLAKLNAAFDDSAGTNYIAPTSPRRTAPAPKKPFSEMTKDELLDQLRIEAPRYEAARRAQTGG